MKIEIKSDQKQIGRNRDRLSLWVFRNDKTFICSITVQEREDNVLLTIIPNDTTIKTIVCKPDPTAQNYEYIGVESPKQEK
jgi:hypothetical protein